MLNEAFLFLMNAHNVDVIFQQDDASIHTAQATKKEIQDSNVSAVNWPAGSSNLKSTGDIWRVMTRHMLQGGR